MPFSRNVHFASGPNPCCWARGKEWETERQGRMRWLHYHSCSTGQRLGGREQMVSKHREAGRPTRGGPWVGLGPGSSRGTVGETLPQGLKLITGSQPNPSWQQKELMLSFLGEKTCPSAPGGIHLWGKRVKWSQLSGRGVQLLGDTSWNWLYCTQS